MSNSIKTVFITKKSEVNYSVDVYNGSGRVKDEAMSRKGIASEEEAVEIVDEITMYSEHTVKFAGIR